MNSAAMNTSAAPSACRCSRCSTCGATDDDREALRAGLDYLRAIRPKLDGNGGIAADDHSQTYTVSLQTMVYVLAGHPEDRDRIQENVDWLLAARIPKFGLLDLRQAGRDHAYDASNTQYALLALHEAHSRRGARGQDGAGKIQKFYLDDATARRLLVLPHATEAAQHDHDHGRPVRPAHHRHGPGGGPQEARRRRQRSRIAASTRTTSRSPGR